MLLHMEKSERHEPQTVPRRKMDTRTGLYAGACTCGWESDGLESEAGALKSAQQHADARNVQDPEDRRTAAIRESVSKARTLRAQGYRIRLVARWARNDGDTDLADRLAAWATRLYGQANTVIAQVSTPPGAVTSAEAGVIMHVSKGGATFPIHWLPKDGGMVASLFGLIFTEGPDLKCMVDQPGAGCTSYFEDAADALKFYGYTIVESEPINRTYVSKDGGPQQVIFWIPLGKSSLHAIVGGVKFVIKPDGQVTTYHAEAVSHNNLLRILDFSALTTALAYHGFGLQAHYQSADIQALRDAGWTVAPPRGTQGFGEVGAHGRERVVRAKGCWVGLESGTVADECRNFEEDS